MELGHICRTKLLSFGIFRSRACVIFLKLKRHFLINNMIYILIEFKIPYIFEEF